MQNEQNRIELAAAHRALALYGLNEGVNNHISMKSSVCCQYSMIHFRHIQINIVVIFNNIRLRMISFYEFDETRKVYKTFNPNLNFVSMC